MSDTRDTNPTLYYYEAEMRYLREAAREFAEQQPEAAKRLGLHVMGALDENVETVFQGFAFLMARLRTKLDDALPELTDPLIDNLWPPARRAMPSLAILECEPNAGQTRKLDTVPAALVVRSAPVGPAGTRCLYRTTQPVRMLPLRLREAAPAVRNNGRTVIRLAFDLLADDQQARDALSRIRLYLHADRPVASAIYAALTAQVSSIDARMPGVDGGRARPQPGMRIEPAGFGPQTRLWPADDAGKPAKPPLELDAEQTMLEYFAFPEKFHFVDLCGFDAASMPLSESHLEFEIVLDGCMPGDISFGTDNVRLFCTPVINLFETDALPLHLVDGEQEYRVRARDGEYVEPHEVISLTATDPETAEHRRYLPFKAFRHRGGLLRHDVPERYFHAATRIGVTGRRELWVSLGGQQWNAPGSMVDRHLTARVLAGNAGLPGSAHMGASIDEPLSEAPGVRAVRNLTPPTMPCYPPRGGSYDWQVLSHFASRSLDYLDTRELRRILALYDWTGRHDNARRIEAVQDVRYSQDHSIGKHILQREFRIHVTIDPAGFAGPGDVVLFGQVLNRFVSRYATLHYGVRLVLVEAGSGRQTVFPPTGLTGSGL